MRLVAVIVILFGVSPDLWADKAITCSYSGGFQKGLQDFSSGSYGADPDKFCYAVKEDDRSAFLTAYDEGRDHAYLFQKVKITTVPQNHEEFLALVKEARGLMVQLEKPALESKAIDERLKTLENENKALKDQISTMRGISLDSSSPASPSVEPAPPVSPSPQK